jgi:hypothetical protein
MLGQRFMRKTPPRRQFLHLGLASIILAIALLAASVVIAILCFHLDNSAAVFSADEIERLLGLILLLFFTLAILFSWISTVALRNRKYLPDGSASPAVGEQAVCAECQGIFNAEKMIQHQSLRVCARCKPIFLQKLAEGAKLTPGSAHEKFQQLL